MHTTSASLLERLRAPSPVGAWERFVDLYTPLLFDWCRRFGLQEADAADVVQDTIVSLFRSLPEFRYRPGHGFRGWLYTVTQNKCREFRRRRRSVPSEPLPDGLAEPDADPIEAATRGDYLSHVLRHTLEWMRAEFPSPTWEICWQHLVEDRPAAELAERFGVTLNVVYLSKSRVLKRLRSELAGLLEE